MIKVLYLRPFTKGLVRLHPDIKALAEEREDLFKENPFHPSLRTHSLSGKMNGLWSFSVDRRYRIVFRFDRERQSAVFLVIGTHDVYE